MKKRLLLVLAAAVLSTGLMAGGIVTNSNQSAAYARMIARNAVLGIEGVFYNPAGLMKMDNGFHFSLNNQTIYQTKDVTNDYQYLNGKPVTYTGKVKVPVYPCIYAAYKMDKFAFSFGFNPIGGGGGAKYDKGLPSFEMPISDLVPSLNSGFGVTGYKADINFEGTSVYFGYQFGFSYEINPMISVFAGLRYVTVKNTYQGYIKNIMINPLMTNPVYDGSFIHADQFGTDMATYYTGVSTYYTGVATQLNSSALGLDPLISGGAGGLTPAQAKAIGAITAQQQAQIEGGLAAIGQPTTLTISQAQGAFYGAATQATVGAAQATGGATQMTGLALKTSDKEVDVVQKGTGITPILGVNLTLAEKLTIAIKYEFLTKINLTNDTKTDDTGLFPDKAKTASDMPAMLSIGASYPVTDKFKASLGFNMYFDRSADYGKKDTLGAFVANKDVIDHNYVEVSLGLEYDLTDKLLVSAGFLRSQTGVSKNYENDLSYSLTSNSVGFGGQYKITPAIAMNLGFIYTKYQENDKTFNHKLGASYIAVNEKYMKSNWMVGIGVDFKIGK